MGALLLGVCVVLVLFGLPVLLLWWVRKRELAREEAPARRLRMPSRRVALVAGTLAVLAGLAWLAWEQFPELGERWAFEKRVQDLRRAGEPIELRELRPAALPPDRNANRWLLEAHAWLEEHKPVNFDHDIQAFTRRSRGFAEQDAFRRELKRLAPYIELLERAARCDAGYIALDDHPFVPVDEWHALEMAAKCLVAIARADPDGAVRSARLLLTLPRCVFAPGLDGLENDWLVHTIGVLKEAATFAAFDARVFRTEIEPLAADPARERGPPAFRLRKHRTWLVWLGRNPDHIREHEPARLSTLYADLNRGLDGIAAALPACDGPAEQAIAFDEKRPWAMAFHEWGSHVASLRLFRVAMAVLAHRQEHHDWPKSLAELGPLPVNPHTGRPFRYESSDAGARLYHGDGDLAAYDFREPK